MDIHTQCFLYKMFEIVYLTEFEKMTIRDISFIMEEKPGVITTYYQIGQIKSFKLHEQWGGHKNGRTKTGIGRPPE